MTKESLFIRIQRRTFWISITLPCYIALMFVMLYNEMKRRTYPRILVYGDGDVFDKFVKRNKGCLAISSRRKKITRTWIREGVWYDEDRSEPIFPCPSTKHDDTLDLTRVEEGLVCHFSNGIKIRTDVLFVVCPNDISLLERLGTYKITHVLTEDIGVGVKGANSVEIIENLKIELREDGYLVKSEILPVTKVKRGCVHGVFGTFVPFSKRIFVIDGNILHPTWHIREKLIH
jgi:hypothetical protein